MKVNLIFLFLYSFHFFLPSLTFAENKNATIQSVKKIDSKSEEKKESPSQIQTAVFGGGCFWCMQPPFDALKNKGVLKTTVGYAGGDLVNPTYEQVSSGSTGHKEVIEITFDATKISYQELLNVFWVNIDPYDKLGQFCDKGEHYLAGIYFVNEEQKRIYEKSIDEFVKKGLKKEKLANFLLPHKKFYPAEEYHQEYYLKNPIRYKFYRNGCGRDKRLKEVWGPQAQTTEEFAPGSFFQI